MVFNVLIFHLLGKFVPNVKWSFDCSTMGVVYSSDNEQIGFYEEFRSGKMRFVIIYTNEELMEKYLYDANSPYRNEDYYGAYIGRLAVWDGISPELRGKYAFQVERTSKNKVGTVAADFRFSDKTGKIRTLHGIKAPMTLLFFSNPGCEACMSIINVLKEDPQISSMISSGRLKVLNIYRRGSGCLAFIYACISRGVVQRLRSGLRDQERDAL